MHRILKIGNDNVIDDVIDNTFVRMSSGALLMLDGINDSLNQILKVCFDVYRLQACIYNANIYTYTHAYINALMHTHICILLYIHLCMNSF